MRNLKFRFADITRKLWLRIVIQMDKQREQLHKVGMNRKRVKWRVKIGDEKKRKRRETKIALVEGIEMFIRLSKFKTIEMSGKLAQLFNTIFYEMLRTQDLVTRILRTQDLKSRILRTSHQILCSKHLVKSCVKNSI
ncbi:hypothetical protein Bhyg_10469 [Pseudolycoriella hygida]|uniref:Uncharacterized protein n=1 Tax=Pseudolycoriella hygida TaxID=35572 RepID=A0A9Q0RZ98_9DIPT|nr:hypothetical protein Bhyg_10469 [Pseudolycoriella hygida]